MPGRDGFTYKSYINSIYTYRSHTHQQHRQRMGGISPTRVTQTPFTKQTRYARQGYTHLQELHKLHLKHGQDMPGRDRFTY